MDSFTDKELSLMESLASGINEARNIEDYLKESIHNGKSR
ncbi:TPA: hypothetical protein ACIZVA_002096, partial [Streptococcus agalactiae]